MPKKKSPTSSRPRKGHARPVSPVEVAEAGTIIELHEEHRLTTEDLSMDTGIWGRARVQWMLGDWDSLASLDPGYLEHLPRRAELAALSACALLQKGDGPAARKALAAASRWKCAPTFMVRALVAGTEASLARYQQLCGRERRAADLLASSAEAFGGDGRLSAAARQALAKPPAQAKDEVPPAPESHSARTAHGGRSSPDTLPKAIELAKQEGNPWAKRGITSYAQNFEDVMLWRALGHVENGFYIDIGAQHPVTDSVSKAFYDNGWRGIHVEPVKEYADLLRQDRPDETVIEAAVSVRHGTTSLHTLVGTGLSTLSAPIAEMHSSAGHPTERRQVTTLTLDDIFHFAGARDIHWLKIDVEGGEAEVLHGWKTSAARPWIICVECVVPNSRVACWQEWEDVLLHKDYEQVYFDGLNRFYSHVSQPSAKQLLSVPPNVFDAFGI